VVLNNLDVIPLRFRRPFFTRKDWWNSQGTPDSCTERALIAPSTMQRYALLTLFLSLDVVLWTMLLENAERLIDSFRSASPTHV
jgi:hypothetical protein